MTDMKREFKDLIRFEQYDCLNSEIKGSFDEAHAVKCVNGIFVGTEEHGVASWLGIPYAKPPVGERRFKAPEYVDACDKVFEAKYYGKGAFGSLGYEDCIQKQMSEDCLYLNIWANTDDKSVKKPVMVWIHGGAYVVGSGEGNATCGDILISGGTVTAEGECDAAGIGTGARGSVGSITVTNGVTQVTAKKVLASVPHSIGGGKDYVSIGTVTVGDKVGPVSESPFVYKP